MEEDILVIAAKLLPGDCLALRATPTYEAHLNRLLFTTSTHKFVYDSLSILALPFYNTIFTESS
jgi:hypothetical protein